MRNSKLLLVSTAGPPSGFFHAVCTLPDPDVRVIRVDRNENPHADPKVLGFLSRLLTHILPLAAKRDLQNLFAAADGDRFLEAEAWDRCASSPRGVRSGRRRSRSSTSASMRR